MPTIRNGRGELEVFDMGVPPPASPSGPIERSQVSAQRMADFAAERARAADRQRKPSPAVLDDQARAAASRARGAKAGGFVKGATKPIQEGPVPPRDHHDAGTNRVRQQAEEGAAAAMEKPPLSAAAFSDGRGRRKLPRDRAERNALVLEAVRASASHAEAATRLGVGKARVEQIVSELRRSDQLPADVRAALDARRHSISVAGGKVRAAQRRAEPEGREASAPATAADDGGTTGGPSPRPPELLPPPGPSEPAPGIAEEYSAPDSTRSPDVVLPCDGCVHAAVCSIKPDLDRWVERMGAPAPPHPAITVAAISIACAHELQAAS